MTERPILFSAPMVRAILEGRKTQTRRIVTVPWKGAVRSLPYEPYFFDTDGVLEMACDSFEDSDCGSHACPYTKHIACPYGAPGGRLWVRETWASAYAHGRFGTVFAADGSFVQGARKHAKGPHFNAEWKGLTPQTYKWRPSIFLPRWASRISLEVTGTRVERLHAITEDDARAEGVETSFPGRVTVDGKRGKPSTIHTFGPDAHRKAFAMLWDAINGKRAPWASSPWVWVVSFRRVTP